MSLKLRGVPEWLTKVEGDETYLKTRTLTFSDSTNNNRTYVCKGVEAWVDDDINTKFSISWANGEGSFTDSTNNVKYILTRTVAYVDGVPGTLFRYSFKNSFKGLEKELNKLETFAISQGANFGSGVAGRPYVCIITNDTDSTLVDFFKADAFERWGLTSEGYYSATIGYPRHKKGFINSESGFYPGEVGWDASTAKALIVPQVKTYSLSGTASAGNIVFEEVYDSANINVQTGEVILYSELNTPVYLVLIY